MIATTSDITVGAIAPPDPENMPQSFWSIAYKFNRGVNVSQIDLLKNVLEETVLVIRAAENVFLSLQANELIDRFL